MERKSLEKAMAFRSDTTKTSVVNFKMKKKKERVKVSSKMMKSNGNPFTVKIVIDLNQVTNRKSTSTIKINKSFKVK